MKRLIVIGVLLALAGTVTSVFGQDASDLLLGQKHSYLGSGNKDLDPLYLWAYWIQNQVLAGGSIGTGKVFYVDSGVTNEGDGTTWDKAVNTIAEGIALCTADRGDVILLAQGHAENLSAATIFKANVAGITIIGCGEGAARATFTTTATAGVMHLNAANVTVMNVRVLCGINNTTALAKIQGDDCTIYRCYFGEGGADGDMNGVTAISVGVADGDSDRAAVIGNEIRCPTSGQWVQGILLNKDMSGIRVLDNHIYGDWSSGAAIEGQASSNAQVDCKIARNTLYNTDTGEPVIEILDTGSTGEIIGNACFSDTDGTVIDAGGLLIDGTNTWNVTATNTNLGAAPAVLMIDSVNNMIGYDDNDNLASTSNVASNRDGSILERLEFIAKYFETGTAGALVAPANTRSILDILGSDGTTTTGALAGSLLGAIGTNEAAVDTAFTSGSVADDADGSVLERLEHVQSDTDKIDGVTLGNPVANSVAAFVAGGNGGLGTQLAASKSLVDALGTNGSTVQDVNTAITGIIGKPTDADHLTDSSSVTANGNGSVFERLEAVQTNMSPYYRHPNYIALTVDVNSATWNTAASHEILTVTGTCRVQILIECTESVTSTGSDSTFALGFEGNAAAIIAATDWDSGAQAFVAGDVMSVVYAGTCTTPASGADTWTGLTGSLIDVIAVGGKDIGYTIGTAAADNGTVVFHIWWEPLSSTGSCTVGAGGAL